MKTKIFISYSDVDRRKVEILKLKFSHSAKFELVIVADKKSKMISLAMKVALGIKSSEIFIPIITRDSISAQWLNQEIGFATLLKDTKQGFSIIPVVDKNIIEKLKGFVHKENDLSFHYDGNKKNIRIENKSYSKTINALYDYLHSSDAEERTQEPSNDLERLIVGKRFEFVYNKTANRSKTIEFLSNGEIGEGKNKNEFRWEINGNKLVIFNDQNQLYSRFVYNIRSGTLINTNDVDTLSLRDQYMSKI